MHRQDGFNIEVSDTEEEFEYRAEDQAVPEDMDSDLMQSINCMQLTANQQMEFPDNSDRPSGMLH